MNNQKGTKSCENGKKTIQSDTKSNTSGTNSKKSEKFSNRELEEMMGMNRDTYRRGPGGAIRRN